MRGADQAGLIGIVADRHELDLDLSAFRITAVRPITSSPTRLPRKPPPITIRSVSFQPLVLR